jgi:O-antigen biosynthesis protein WbqV
LNEDAGILVPELGAPVNILDLANRMIREAGYRSDEIEVVFSGLRPGDKLSEDLISSAEWLEPTSDSRLQKINGPRPSPSHFDSAMEAISERVNARILEPLVETLCELVPEYQPSETLLRLRNGELLVGAQHGCAPDAQP